MLKASLRWPTGSPRLSLQRRSCSTLRGLRRETLALFALTLLPYSLLGPFTGVLVDRWRRRSILVWANVAARRAAREPAFVDRCATRETALYASLLLLLGLGRLFLTTKGASLPVVLREHHLLRGNAVSGGLGMIFALVGGVAGLGAAAFASTETAFIMAGLLYATGALIARRISNPMAHPHKHLERMRDAAARIGTELVDGVREIWKRERARLPLLGIFVLRIAAMFVALIAIEIIRTEYAAADDSGRLSASALALGAAGVGAFIGALMAPAMGRRFSTPALLIVGFVVSGASMVVAAPVLQLTTTVGLALSRVTALSLQRSPWTHRSRRPCRTSTGAAPSRSTTSSTTSRASSLPCSWLPCSESR